MKVLNLWKYILAYSLLFALLLSLLLTRSALYLISIIVIPLLITVTALLIGDVEIINRNENLHKAFRNIIAPSVFVYLFFSSLSNLLISHFRDYVTFISYFMSFIILGFIGFFIDRTAKSYELELYESLNYASRFFLFLALGYFFGSLYKPLLYPFAGISLIYLIVSPIPYMAKRWNFDYSGVTNNMTMLTITSFGLGLFYMLLIIPKPPQYNTYILLAFVLMASIAISYAGYKVYTSGTSVVEKITEEIYEKHKREVEVIPSPEFAVFENAIKEFVVNGKKEKLLIYLTHELTKDGLSYESIFNELEELILYNAPVIKKANKKVIESEVNKRLKIVNEVLKKLMVSKNA
ncbi:MAG: hypothetical protein OWQ54_04530 [Sulfolobaceae archaeon]|nr:hypothetical protein [Sulfolobaceae archaeon]